MEGYETITQQTLDYNVVTDLYKNESEEDIVVNVSVTNLDETTPTLYSISLALTDGVVDVQSQYKAYKEDVFEHENKMGLLNDCVLKPNQTIRGVAYSSSVNMSVEKKV